MDSRSHHMVLLPVFPLQALDDNVAAEDAANSMIKLSCPFGQLNNKSITVVGTFKGIVFLVIKSYLATHMILHNPFTTMYKVIPDPPTGSGHYSNFAYGFGYASTPDDLKIVRIEAYYRSRENPQPDPDICDVYSLKDNLWIICEGFSRKYILLEKVGTFLNESLHWLAYSNISMIIAMNLKDLVFSEIQLPVRNPMAPLGTLDGCLCLVSSSSYTSIEVWEMKEYGIADSWSKICSITFDLGHNVSNKLYHMCILKGRKILLVNELKQLFIYDLLKGTYKKLKNFPRFGNMTRSLRCIEYVESLVSPSTL